MMKKILLVPDSFKGTMSSTEVCAIMEEAIKTFYPEAQVISIPVADGGEGSVDAFLAALGGEKRFVSVQGPFGCKMNSFFGILKNGIAIIEMAACAGLPLVGTEKNPLLATTYGAGELIKAALDSGCSKVVMGIGGSATNDGGCGTAVALGVKFFDKAGKAFVPTGGTLHQIEHIDKSDLDPRLKKIELVTMCDIDNPLYGENGAAYIFGPQKGANSDQVQFLDAGLRHLAEIVRKEFLLNIAETAGAGAAGGMGYGMRVFLDSSIQMGIETVLDTVNFNELLEDADCVFTGEGKIDSQSLRGKVIIGIARRTKKANVPLVAIVGAVNNGIDAAYDAGVTAVFCINRRSEDFSQPGLCAKNNLALTMKDILRFQKAFGKII
jgi:glycerate kinase